jgi:hypothetical protein
MTNYDQFYTIPDIAKKLYNILINKIDIQQYDYIVEPSAGNGSFYKLLDENKRIGIDIQPKYEGIIKQDYLKYNFDKKYKYIVIGNPPFGKISNLAIKFYNKSAEYANVIAFILPRTFKRISVQNKLNKNFKLIYNEDLPNKPCCFIPKMNAKCCFQIWIKSDIPRKSIILPTYHPHFNIIKNKELFFNNNSNEDENNNSKNINQKYINNNYNINYINQNNNSKNINIDYNSNNIPDFAIKAYGSNCGKIFNINLDKLTIKNYHFIKSNIDIDILISNFQQLDYSISKDTVRQDSIGKGELIYIYNNKYGK